MDMYEYIRFSHFKLGHSINQIHRETGKAKKTIRKALKGIEPKYRLSKPKERPVIGPYEEIIKNILEEDRKVPKKQRHTAVRIYNRLIEEHGYEGGETTVRDYVRKAKQEMGLMCQEAFIPSDPLKRKGAEVDWGEACVKIDGQLTRVYMFCMRAKYSGKIFVKLYPAMYQECFFSGHIEAFSYFGGVYEEIVYDNLASAVRKVLTGKGRIEQRSFLAFRSHYQFLSKFCNVAKGSEKGGVEGLVGYARRNFLTPIPDCKSLEEVNDKLLEQCLSKDITITSGQSKTVGELHKDETPKLLPLPKLPYDSYKLVETRVDKFSTVKIQTNRYSVPNQYVGCKVTVEVGFNDVRITVRNKLIAKHERTFQRDTWQIDPWHYISVLGRKTRAFKDSRISTIIENDWPSVVKDIWNLQVTEYGEESGTKEFLGTLQFFLHRDFSEMLTTFELALESRISSKQGIFALFEALTEKTVDVSKVDLDNIDKIRGFELPLPDVTKFDQLMGGCKYDES